MSNQELQDPHPNQTNISNPNPNSKSHQILSPSHNEILNLNGPSAYKNLLTPSAALHPSPFKFTTTCSSSTSFTMLENSNSPFIRGSSGGGGHRRAHSEMSFRLPDNMMEMSPPRDPFNGGSSTASFDEIGSEDDLFSTYIDIDKLGGNCGGGNDVDQNGGKGNGSDGKGEANGSVGGSKDGTSGGSGNGSARPRHRHSSSVDGSAMSTGMFGEIMDAKKAMPPDKLAELWNLDPKRAKRFNFSWFFLFGFLGFNLKLSCLC